MRKFLVLIPILLLAACSTTTPVKRNFPDVPREQMESCPNLKQTEQTDKLSDVLKVVVDNYGQYHECQIKADAWIEWYSKQKDIFNNVK
jgi:hypothetical protein